MGVIGRGARLDGQHRKSVSNFQEMLLLFKSHLKTLPWGKNCVSFQCTLQAPKQKKAQALSARVGKIRSQMMSSQIASSSSCLHKFILIRAEALRADLVSLPHPQCLQARASTNSTNTKIISRDTLVTLPDIMIPGYEIMAT